MKTGDWEHLVNGSRQHIRPACAEEDARSPQRVRFLADHARWYKYLRTEVLVGVQHLDLPFEQVTKETKRTLEEVRTFVGAVGKESNYF